MRLVTVCVTAALTLWIPFALAAPRSRTTDAVPSSKDPRLTGAYTFSRGGWKYVHLEGSPEQIGFQHGYLLGPEIADALHVFKVEDEHSTKRDWQFYRNASEKMFWPHIDQEYQAELRGIAEGARARGIHVDVWDIVALNGTMELSEYYVPWLDKHQTPQQRAAVENLPGRPSDNPPSIHAPGNCSAFIATGSWTKDGKIVIAHNNWTTYAEGSRWTIIFDIAPTHGHRILMDGAAGHDHQPGRLWRERCRHHDHRDHHLPLRGLEPERHAGVCALAQGAAVWQLHRRVCRTLIKEGNNGGYANDWLIGDRKTGEIAYLELGLNTYAIWRSKDGYFVSSNFAARPGLIKDETDGLNWRPFVLANARHARWEEEMKENKGQHRH